MIALICFSWLVWLGSGTPIDKFIWLEGAWEMQSPSGSSRLEIWRKKDDTSLTGIGLSIQDTDTTLLESLELAHKDDTYWYVPTVPGQNKGQPVNFKLVQATGQLFVFENPDHDFPQRIIYHFRPAPVTTSGNAPLTSDTLFVRVESLDAEGFEFNFIRKAD